MRCSLGPDCPTAGASQSDHARLGAAEHVSRYFVPARGEGHHVSYFEVQTVEFSPREQAGLMTSDHGSAAAAAAAGNELGQKIGLPVRSIHRADRDIAFALGLDAYHEQRWSCHDHCDSYDLASQRSSACDQCVSVLGCWKSRAILGVCNWCRVTVHSSQMCGIAGCYCCKGVVVGEPWWIALDAAAVAARPEPA